MARPTRAAAPYRLPGRLRFWHYRPERAAERQESALSPLSPSPSLLPNLVTHPRDTVGVRTDPPGPAHSSPGKSVAAATGGAPTRDGGYAISEDRRRDVGPQGGGRRHRSAPTFDAAAAISSRVSSPPPIAPFSLCSVAPALERGIHSDRTQNIYFHPERYGRKANNRPDSARQVFRVTKITHSEVSRPYITETLVRLISEHPTIVYHSDYQSIFLMKTAH